MYYTNLIYHKVVEVFPVEEMLPNSGDKFPGHVILLIIVFLLLIGCITIIHLIFVISLKEHFLGFCVS